MLFQLSCNIFASWLGYSYVLNLFQTTLIRGKNDGKRNIPSRDHEDKFRQNSDNLIDTRFLNVKENFNAILDPFYSYRPQSMFGRGSASKEMEGERKYETNMQNRLPESFNLPVHAQFSNENQTQIKTVIFDDGSIHHFYPKIVYDHRIWE